MPSLVIIGSTGSIGRQTLEVVDEFNDFQVVGLASFRNITLLAEQIIKYNPLAVALIDAEQGEALRTLVPQWSGELLLGTDGLEELTARDDYQILVSAVVGAAGISPTITAIRHGKTIALANKETLVSAGAIVMEEARRQNVCIYPVDSEHSAIFQCLEGRRLEDMRRIYLTASGGPFRTLSREDIEKVRPEAALAHPTWSMGGKITIDSATLMNKGLEVMEAHWLFALPYDDIEVVVHPQSIIHSMVELKDGSIIAQLGPADMRLPIQLALCYPERRHNPFQRIHPLALSRLDFEAPDLTRFPCLESAYYAGRKGGTMPAVLNAANEMAVEEFLQGRIGFYHISDLICRIMEEHDRRDWRAQPGLEEILAVDRWVRSEFHRWLRGISH